MFFQSGVPSKLESSSKPSNCFLPGQAGSRRFQVCFFFALNQVYNNSCGDAIQKSARMCSFLAKAMQFADPPTHPHSQHFRSFAPKKGSPSPCQGGRKPGGDISAFSSGVLIMVYSKVFRNIRVFRVIPVTFCPNRLIFL